MSKAAILILCPSGHRRKVQMTPNSNLLQVSSDCPNCLRVFIEHEAVSIDHMILLGSGGYVQSRKFRFVGLGSYVSSSLVSNP